ncbi:OmpA family protein [Nannocystaceae bacterium ST9]
MPTPSPAFAALLLVACVSPSLACSSITKVEAESPIEIQARPPAPPLPEIAAVEQPPPPAPRVVVEGDRLALDEAIGFDEQGAIAADHADILAEIATWLDANPDVLELAVEVHASGEGSRRAQQKRSKAMADRVVAALVERGVAADRLVATGLGKSEDGQPRVTLRIRERAVATVVEAVVEEKPE